MRKFDFFIHYLKRYLRMLLIAVLLLLADVAVTTAMPWFMSEIVDRGVLAGDLDVIYGTGLQMIGISLLGCIVAFCSGVVMSVMAQKMSNDMRKDLFRKIHSLSFGQTDGMSSGLLVTRIMSDTQIITQFGASLLMLLVKPFALMLFGLGMMLMIHERLMGVFSVAVPIQLILMIVFIRRLNPLFTGIQLRIEKINAHIQESLSNLRLIKSYMSQSREEKNFRQENDDLLGLNLRIQFLLAVMNPLIMLAVNFVLIAIIYVGGGLVRGGEVEVGRVIAAIMYIQQIMMSLMMMGQIFQGAARAGVSCVRLKEIETMTPSVPEGTLSLEDPVRQIRAEELGFRYPGAAEDTEDVLKGLSFDIRPSCLTAIVGPTGCGKSTLAALLARLYLPSSGHLLVNGAEIRDWTEDSLQNRIVIVLQKSALCSGTVADNIRYGLDHATEEEIRAAARISQADEFIRKLPDGYGTMVSQQGNSLSGGQKQCIAVARALLRRPDVLILDDSCSAMDLATERNLRTALRAAYPDLTLIVISQRMRSIMGADQILVLDQGCLTEEGTHAELMQKSGWYREMVLAQSADGGEP